MNGAANDRGRAALVALVAIAFAAMRGAAQAPQAPPPQAPPPRAAPPRAPDAASAPAPQAAEPAPVLEASAESDGATLRLRAMSPRVEVGEPLVLRLEVLAPEGREVRFPRFGSGSSASLGDFEVRGAKVLPIDPQRRAERAQEIEVVSFASGVVKLPPIEVSIIGADGTAQTVGVGPLAIEVTSLIGDADPRSSLRPIKDPVEIRLPRDWRVIAAIAAGAAIAIALAVMLWRRLRRTAPPPPAPAHVVARTQLAALRGEDLPAKGRVLEYYIRLSDIVRRYVEGRFGIRAPEQTTKEFLAAATHHPSIRDGHRTMLAGFLRSADRVKFAADRPGPGDCDRAFDAANAFVDETVPSIDSAASSNGALGRAHGDHGTHGYHGTHGAPDARAASAPDRSAP